MQLTIGSNRLRDTGGIISIRGSRQIVLEWGLLRSDLLLTMDLYGAGGARIARLRRNEWTYNDHDRFEFVANAGGFNLVDTKSSHMVLEARVAGQDSVVITQGAFYSSAGHQIEITMEDWKGVSRSPISPESPTRTTSLPFSRSEIASIREGVESSREPVECPRCGCALTRERLASTAQFNGLLVSCTICRRNLVVRSQSRTRKPD
jgi:hypothetical protein